MYACTSICYAMYMYIYGLLVREQIGMNSEGFGLCTRECWTFHTRVFVINARAASDWITSSMDASICECLVRGGSTRCATHAVCTCDARGHCWLTDALFQPVYLAANQFGNTLLVCFRSCWLLLTFAFVMCNFLVWFLSISGHFPYLILGYTTLLLDPSNV